MNQMDKNHVLHEYTTLYSGTDIELTTNIQQDEYGNYINTNITKYNLTNIECCPKSSINVYNVECLMNAFNGNINLNKTVNIYININTDESILHALNKGKKQIIDSNIITPSDIIISNNATSMFNQCYDIDLINHLQRLYNYNNELYSLFGKTVEQFTKHKFVTDKLQYWIEKYAEFTIIPIELNKLMYINSEFN